jgi:general secretion pathway protein G
MLERLRAARENESGFTLIELLIVIVILGVLAGVVVFAVSAFNSDGIAAACKSDIKTISVASESYFAKTGSRAASIDVLKTGGYIKDLPPTGKYLITYTAATGDVAGAIGTVSTGPAC